MTIAEASQAVATAAKLEAVRLRRRDRNRRLQARGDGLLTELERLRLAGAKHMGSALANACLSYRNAILDEQRANWPTRCDIDAAQDDVFEAVDVVMGWLQPLRPEEE